MSELTPDQELATWTNGDLIYVWESFTAELKALDKKRAGLAERLEALDEYRASLAADIDVLRGAVVERQEARLVAFIAGANGAAAPSVLDQLAALREWTR